MTTATTNRILSFPVTMEGSPSGRLRMIHEFRAGKSIISICENQHRARMPATSPMPYATLGRNKAAAAPAAKRTAPATATKEDGRPSGGKLISSQTMLFAAQR
jgi:hypothetical protein